MNRLADLNYAAIIQEALKMEDENVWENLYVHLLARLTRAGLADLHRLGLRDVCERECVLNGAYRIRLRGGFGGRSPDIDICAGGRVRRRRNGPGCWGRVIARLW
jgi:hypothetical protein